MKKFEFLLLGLIVLFLVVLGFFLGTWRQDKTPIVIVPEGESSDIDTGDWEIYNPYPNDIRVTFPQAGDAITSPLVITGEARGPWYFEATFPVVLTNWDGLIIAEWYAEAQGEWMTTDFVPFTATIEFEKPEYIGDFSRRGALILKNSNASGLPEHDKAIEIPVLFE